jgi:hypothetical protein
MIYFSEGCVGESFFFTFLADLFVAFYCMKNKIFRTENNPIWNSWIATFCQNLPLLHFFDQLIAFQVHFSGKTLFETTVLV